MHQLQVKYSGEKKFQKCKVCESYSRFFNFKECQVIVIVTKIPLNAYSLIVYIIHGKDVRLILGKDIPPVKSFSIITKTIV